MKEKRIFIIVLLVAIVLMHTEKHHKVDTSKMTAQEKKMVDFALGTGM